MGKKLVLLLGKFFSMCHTRNVESASVDNSS
jgi:hypothetical protein